MVLGQFLFYTVSKRLGTEIGLQGLLDCVKDITTVMSTDNNVLFRNVAYL